MQRRPTRLQPSTPFVPIVDGCSGSRSCGDVDCSCVADGNLSPPYGIVSHACFCDRPNTCPDYATARNNCERSAVELFTYPACNLEVVQHYDSSWGPPTRYVYDATTHALVGGSAGTDIPIGMCAGTSIYGRRMGLFPPSDCPFVERKNLCRPDAGI